MTVFGFVRHGITAWNKEGRSQGSSDIPLDEEGMDMAQKIALRLSNDQWDIIYTSPLKRASMTAQAIACQLPALTVIEDARLREVGGGQTEGTTEEERIARWGKDWRLLDLGFEKKEDVLTRARQFIEEVKEAHPNRRVLVVSHGSFIRQIVHEMLHDDAYAVVPKNTSLTIVETTEEQVICSLFNCTKHLL